MLYNALNVSNMESSVLTLLGLGLIKINAELANFNNPRWARETAKGRVVVFNQEKGLGLAIPRA